MVIKNLLNKKTNQILLLSSILVVFVIIISISGGDTNVEQLPYEPTSGEISKTALLDDPSGRLYTKLGGSTRWSLLSDSIYFYGKYSYDVYSKNNRPVIGFIFDKKIDENGDEIKLSGKFGSVKNKININLKNLPNNRLKISIIDLSTNINMDNKLPANSKFNDYISKLPQFSSNYSVEYNNIDDTIVINLYDRDPTLLKTAKDSIKKLIDDGSYNENMIQSLYPQESFGF